MVIPMVLYIFLNILTSYKLMILFVKQQKISGQLSKAAPIKML